MGDIIEEHLNFNGHIDEVAMIAWYHLHAIILIIALYNVFVIMSLADFTIAHFFGFRKTLVFHTDI